MRVTPKSAREGIDGVVETAQGPALTMRVRAVAEKGEANRAVEVVVAGWLGVPKSSVAVTAGGKSRLKTVLVTGQPDRLASMVESYVSKLH